jgi:hypothetical protein
MDDIYTVTGGKAKHISISLCSGRANERASEIGGMKQDKYFEGTKESKNELTSTPVHTTGVTFPIPFAKLFKDSINLLCFALKVEFGAQPSAASTPGEGE